MRLALEVGRAYFRAPRVVASSKQTTAINMGVRRVRDGVLARSFHAEASMTGHALPHHIGQRGKCWPHVVAGAGILRLDREAAGRSMHLCSNLLHTLRHEGREVCSTMRFE